MNQVGYYIGLIACFINAVIDPLGHQTSGGSTDNLRADPENLRADFGMFSFEITEVLGLTWNSSH